jgi:hypothetical protein
VRGGHSLRDENPLVTRRQRHKWSAGSDGHLDPMHVLGADGNINVLPSWWSMGYSIDVRFMGKSRTLTVGARSFHHLWARGVLCVPRLSRATRPCGHALPSRREGAGASPQGT